jgi:hypothetical protein
MAKVAFYEVGQLVVLDRLLILMIFFAGAVSIYSLHKESSKYFLLVLLALWVTGAINGTIGVNFRYQLPLIPFMAYSILESTKINVEVRSRIKN